MKTALVMLSLDLPAEVSCCCEADQVAEALEGLFLLFDFFETASASIGHSCSQGRRQARVVLRQVLVAQQSPQSQRNTVTAHRWEHRRSRAAHRASERLPHHDC